MCAVMKKGMKTMPIKSDREYRNLMEFRANEELEREEGQKVVEGYATTFDSPYVLWEDDNVIFSETIDPNAFDSCDMRDVIMQYNHEGRVFARISNGTLEVEPDEHGLHIMADLGGTEIGRQLYDEIRGGYTDKMSFGFVVSEDDYDEIQDDNGKFHVLRKISGISKLYDVSAVSIPANDATEISIRTLSDGVIQKVEAERLKAKELEIARKRLEVKSKAVSKGW